MKTKILCGTIFAIVVTAFFSACGGSSGTYGGGSGGNITPGTTTFTVTDGDAPSAYTVNCVDNAGITLQRGQTYTFNISTTGHPFYLKTVQGNGTSNALVAGDGVTNNGTDSGTITYVVPVGAPNTLFYDCSIHPAMSGVIGVTN